MALVALCFMQFHAHIKTWHSRMFRAVNLDHDMFNDIKWHKMTGGVGRGTWWGTIWRNAVCRKFVEIFAERNFCRQAWGPRSENSGGEEEEERRGCFSWVLQGKWANTQKITRMSKTCAISSWSCWTRFIRCSRIEDMFRSNDAKVNQELEELTGSHARRV